MHVPKRKAFHQFQHATVSLGNLDKWFDGPSASSNIRNGIEDVRTPLTWHCHLFKARIPLFTLSNLQRSSVLTPTFGSSEQITQQCHASGSKTRGLTASPLLVQQPVSPGAHGAPGSMALSSLWEYFLHLQTSVSNVFLPTNPNVQLFNCQRHCRIYSCRVKLWPPPLVPFIFLYLEISP